MNIINGVFLLIFIGILLLSLIVLSTAYWGWSD